MSYTGKDGKQYVLVTAGGGLWLTDRDVPLKVAVAAVAGTMAVVGGANALNLRQEFAKLLRHLTKHALARMPLRKSTRIIGGALEPPCKIRPRPFNLCRTRRFTRQATERLRDELQRLRYATRICATRDH
jgi:hypothetical protein